MVSVHEQLLLLCSPIGDCIPLWNVVQVSIQATRQLVPYRNTGTASNLVHLLVPREVGPVTPVSIPVTCVSGDVVGVDVETVDLLVTAAHTLDVLVRIATDVLKVRKTFLAVFEIFDGGRPSTMEAINFLLLRRHTTQSTVSPAVCHSVRGVQVADKLGT